MGIDLALILGIMGTVWVGNPLSLNPGFSIGGPVQGRTDNLLGNVLGLLGKILLSENVCYRILTAPRNSSWTPGIAQLDRVRLFPYTRRSLCNG